MWTKAFRKSLISGIYQTIFRQSLEGLEKSVNWDVIVDEYSTSEIEVKKDDLEKVFVYVDKNFDSYITSIQKYSKNWNRTFDVIKACLVALIVEIEYKKDSNESIETTVVGKYIRLAQDFAGGDNPGLVHAIGSKLVTEYSA